jgi:hypothetical protein
MGSQITLTTSWARYSVTFVVPSISGLTIGTNSVARIIFRMAAATVQSVDFWGVQLEDGSIATPFRRNSPNLQAELAACERYFVRLPGFTTVTAVGVGSASVIFRAVFPVQMRANPSMTLNNGTVNWSDDYAVDGSLNATSIGTFTGTSTRGARATLSGTAAANNFVTGRYYELGGQAVNGVGTASLDISAEL